MQELDKRTAASGAAVRFDTFKTAETGLIVKRTDPVT